ncbi:helix-turn-helix transcriptional regulator [Streptomyces toxytricini]|uniref:helix-turn-helix transcriptional regulator n=1 Tax=Streptomyces toxytricini TaxID=67369 RepID=UPI003423FFF7
MDEPTAISPGRVLRVWREYAGLSAADLARALSAERSAVSMWESDRRARRPAASLARIEQIAACFEGRRGYFTADHASAMVAMWQAASLVTATPARSVWFHNWPKEGGPVWIWLRADPGSRDRRVLLEFGPFAERLSVPLHPGGVVVHSPMSVPNPPLKVTFYGCGWADFAVGDVPPEVAGGLGIERVAAADVIGRHSPRTPPLDGPAERELGKGLAALRGLAADFSVRWSVVAPHLGDLLPVSLLPSRALDGDAVESAVHSGAVVTDSRGTLVTQLLMDPGQIRQIRVARGLSRAAAARQATDHDRLHPLSEKALESLESTGRVPDVPQALARLDMVYGMDGRLGIDRVFDSAARAGPAAGHKHLDFPDFWSGHVWLQARGPHPDATGVIELVWGPWRRRRRLRSATVVTTRKATPGSPPLQVRLPRGWHLAAGTGAVPTALDINAGWRPANTAAALNLLRESVQAIRAAKRE